jgi:NADH-quinone oxidoreductase subunit J
MLFFSLIAPLIILSALGVVLSRKPIYSALSLILNLVLVAMIYAQLNAHFLAVTQILVYAGAIMVLVMFVIMLLNAGGDADTKNGKDVENKFLACLTKEVTPLRLVVSLLMAASFLTLFYQAIVDRFAQSKTTPEALPYDVNLDYSPDTATLGGALFGRFLVPFEISSILILTSIVAAVMIASHISKNRGVTRDNFSKKEISK